MLEMEIGSFMFKIGKNAMENDQLLNEANQNDLWFHLEGNASPHGILFTNGEKAGKNELWQCANMVKMGSKLKALKNVNVIFTERRNVKKTEKIGAVIAKNTKVIKVK